MALYTEKTFEEAHNPLANYSGNDAFVKGQIYSINNGGDMYDYSRNLKGYSKALMDAKANDNDNFWSGLGEFFVGRGTDKLRADLADEYTKAYEANPYVFDTDAYKKAKESTKGEKDLEKGTLFEGGVLGGLINPFTQSGKALYDLGQGIGGNWDAWNKRDHVSDLGAGLEAALEIATAGSASGAKAGAKTLGKTLAKTAATGAGYGFAGGLRDMGSENFDAGNLALRTGIGGLVGGAIGGAGYGLGKLKNLATSVDKKAISDRLSNYSKELANSEGAQYQNALKTLQDAGVDTTSSSTLKDTFRNFVKANHPDRGGDEALFKTVSTARDTYEKLLEKSGGDTSKLVTPTLDLSSIPRVKPKTVAEAVKNIRANVAANPSLYRAGTKISNLLGSKAGKRVALAGAGVGGGLLLSRLWNNNNNGGTGTMSDQDIYNYVYGGQQ